MQLQRHVQNLEQIGDYLLQQLPGRTTKLNLDRTPQMVIMLFLALQSMVHTDYLLLIALIGKHNIVFGSQIMKRLNVRLMLALQL